MVKTFDDLKREVASRLRNALHEREINMMDDVKPQLPHMLGITPIGKMHDPQNEEMSLMDPKHSFWDKYVREIRTKGQARKELEDSVVALLDDGTFRKKRPYPDDSLKSEVVYCEVDDVHNDTNNMKTSCKECGALLTTRPDLVQDRGRYYLKFSLDCPECDFSRVYEHYLTRG